jgi:uncharacterized membrane protein
MGIGPTIPPPAPDSLKSSLQRNIDALRERRVQENELAPLQARVAQRITRFSGSMCFVYLHALLYGGWLLLNLGVVPGVRAWDPTFVTLAMIASVEAIFLSTFILISQNRMTESADRRAELDLQVSLLAEQEITKLVQLVSKMSASMGIPDSAEPEVEEMKRGVAPEAVLDAIEQTEMESNRHDDGAGPGVGRT